jgi:TrmH family RNA methyltransferase
MNKREVKYIQSLYHKKNRDEESVFVVEGPKMVAELLSGNYSIKKIFATNEWINNNADAKCELITAEELAKISFLQTPNQVLAIVEQKKNNGLPNIQNKITLALDGIQDPGNMGTILRIADWFGIENILAGEGTADVYNHKVIQASIGSFLRVNVFSINMEDFLSAAQLPVFGAMLGGKSLYEIQKLQEAIIVIGNESNGIRENLLPYIHKSITIPRMGKAVSLNAAVATGIILSHII